MRHVFVPFSEDLHQHIWRSLTTPTTILFAHEGQKKSFVSSYQNESTLNQHTGLTLESFVQEHLQVESPIISPDQRWLLIAKSLTSSHRDALSLSSHRACVSFARRLYGLWTVAWESGQSFNEADSTWDDWQRPWIKICREVLAAYQKNLGLMGYTDPIFLSFRQPKVQPIVLANIVAMPLSARRLLEQSDVLAFHQGPSHWFDANSGALLSMSEWTNDKGPIKTRSVKEITVAHESQERQELSALTPVNVTDPRQRPLWLTPPSISMTRTMLFQFWNTWLLISKKRSGSRFPIDLVKKILFNQAFSTLYQWPDEVIIRFWRSLKDGVRWWDRQDFMPESMIADERLLFPLDVNSLDKWIKRLPDTIWTERGLDEIRYQFGSVWESFKVSFKEGLIPPGSALDYLVDRLSTRSVKQVDINPMFSRQPKDCLNVALPERFFTGVMEGAIPASVEPPWLLMPKQLSAWGLLTPLMHQSVDAYAWTQAVLTSEKATLILYHNGHDLRPPSLWTWLRDGLPLEVNTIVSPQRESSVGQASIEKRADSLSSGLPVKLSTFPPRPLSYSAYDTWRNCPYQYALSKGYRLTIADTDALNRVDPAFMGRLAHDWLEVVMSDSIRLKTADLTLLAKQVWARNTHRWPLDLVGVLVDKILIPDLVDMAKGLLKAIDQQIGFDHIAALFHEDAADIVLPRTDDVILSGRADLRIETKNNDYWIIDYKSGSQANDLQLNWYALLYYGHIHPSQIKLAFFDIPSRRFKLVKTQLDKLNAVDTDWQKALAASTQPRTDKRSHCQYCGFGELCRK